MKITTKQLRQLGACKSQVELFERLFGAEVEVTEVLCLKHAGDFDWDWAACDLLPPGARKAHEEACAPAREAYEEACALARKAHEEACAPAWRAYEEARAPAREAYDEACALARKAYEEARAPAREAYDEACALARKAHEEACALAFAHAANLED